MKIFDSSKEKKCSGRNFTSDGNSIVFKKSSRAKVNFPCFEPGIYSLRIVGKKRTGKGNLLVKINGPDGETLHMKDLVFPNKSWSEFIFRFVVRDENSQLTMTITRKATSFGATEVGRIVIEKVQDSSSKNKNIVSEVLHPESVELVNNKFLKKQNIAIIIPYQIYGGAEVYLRNYINKIDNSSVSFRFLFMRKNLLQFYLEGKNVSYKICKTLDNLSGELITKNYDKVIYYNRADIYKLLSGLKSSNSISSELVEIYHSDFKWQGSLSSVPSRKNLKTMITVSKTIGLDISGEFERVLVPVPINVSDFKKRALSSIPDDIRALKKQKPVIGLVARLSKEKNVGYAIKLAEICNEFDFIIIGDGPDRERLQNMVNEKNLSNVFFAGFQKNVKYFYNIMDGFILASNMEGTPVSILEAMSSEVVVFSNMVGAIPDLILDGITGFSITGIPEDDVSIIRNNIFNKDVALKARQYVIKNHDIDIFKYILQKAILDCGKSDIYYEGNDILSGEFV